MIFNLSPGNLNEMDMGVHMALMDEWNEDANFQWGPAVMILQGFHTVIIQEDGKAGLHVATYVTSSEGELVSLRCYTPQDPGGTEYWHARSASDDAQRSIDMRRMQSRNAPRTS